VVVSDFNNYEINPADRATAGVLDVGDVLGTTASAVGTNLFSFVSMTTLILMPAMIGNFIFQYWPMLAGSNFEPSTNMLFLGGQVLNGIMQFVLSYVAQAAMMFVTIEYMAGRHASIGDALTKALTKAPVVLLIAILMALVTGVGMVLCIVPGVILTCILFVSVPAAVAEDLGPIEALQRSSELTDGHRTTIFLAWLAMMVAVITMSCGIGMVTGVGTMAGVTGSEAVSRVALLFGFALSWVINVAYTAVFAAMTAVVYARIRGIRDNVDAHSLAQVFA